MMRANTNERKSISPVGHTASNLIAKFKQSSLITSLVGQANKFKSVNVQHISTKSLFLPDSIAMPPAANIKFSQQIPKGMKTYADFLKKDNKDESLT